MMRKRQREGGREGKMGLLQVQSQHFCFVFFSYFRFFDIFFFLWFEACVWSHDRDWRPTRESFGRMKREQKKQEREGGGEGERESRRCVRLKAITLNKHCLGVLSLSLSLPSMSDARKMMTGRHLHVAVVSEKAKVKEEVMTGSMSFSFSISLPPSPSHFQTLLFFLTFVNDEKWRWSWRLS